ncbi:MAG: cysteine synthase family protein [Gemmatimonadales bacterium]|nr:cysteine synthase family protein [Gemmatimonadales bacterium]MDQ3427469.1 cysteine synthase family protein [Gemmatimonadota bacterium]
MTAVRQRSTTREPDLWRAVGNTPLLALDLPGAERGRLWLKAEWLNPGGSVKDRAARAILRDALRRGLVPAKRLLDASSGNTGIAYAMLGAAAGVGVTICLPGNASPERRALLERYGAEVVTTDRLEGTDGAARRARELAEAEPDRYYYADQYSNPANSQAHRDTTGPEIWRQTGGRVTHFVAALGTTGTMMGTGSYLKEKNPAIQLVGVQPDSPLHGLEGLKHLATTRNPPALYDPDLPDLVAEIPTETADRTARRLAREAGILVGWSAGAAVAAALDLLRLEPEAAVVVIGCDTGTRYLSEPHRWEER